MKVVPVTGEGLLLLVNERDVVLHSGSGSETLATQVAGVRSALQVHHLFAGIGMLRLTT